VQHRLAQQPADQHDAAQPRGVEGGILRARRQRQHGHQRHQALQGRYRRRVPLPAFVNIGDLIKIDTRTGEYLERVKE